MIRASSPPRRVVVTGLGLATSLGVEVDTVWDAVVAGRCGVGELRQFPAAGFPIGIGSEVNLAALPDDPDVLVQTSRTLRFASWAAQAAFRDAGLGALSPEQQARAGVSIGAGLFPAMEDRIERSHRRPGARGRFDAEWLEGIYASHPELLSQQCLSGVADLLASRIGLAGPCRTVQSACTSGTQAIGDAFHQIRRGNADIMLAGGADSMMSTFCVIGFAALGALSRNPDPARASRPFDAKRDGFVLGEGAGIAVLEEREHALARGASVYAEVAGYGSSCDAYRLTDAEPEGRGAAAAMRRALESAALQPSAISYINAHGTSTVQNDLAETRAIKAVFGPAAACPPVSSTKSQLGHLICAAGGIEFLLTCLSVRRGVIPPTINLSHPGPECDLDYVPNEARSQRLNAALSNSFGFGGQNACLIVSNIEHS